VTKIRTVSEAKREFYTHYNRPISSVYRRVVEELLVEMHLLTVNVDFRYDPFFALGAVTSFGRFMQGYQPEADLDTIFNALCQAIAVNPQQYRQDSQALLVSVRGLSVTELLSQITAPSSGDRNLLLASLQDIARSPRFKYSRLFAIGLYTLLLTMAPELKEQGEKCQQLLSQFAQVLKIADEKLQKDLELYRSNLDKVDQLLKVLAEAAEADRKKRERQATVAQPEPTPQ